MHTFPLALCSALLSLPFSLAAQGYVASPLDLLSVEGDSAARTFGAYASARYMLFDGEVRGAALALKELALRDDFRPYAAFEGVGRQWTSVTIRMAECDAGSISPVFSQNAQTTPTQVFSASVSWPTQTGLPSNYPPAWSKTFPFAAAWSYGGTKDICIDADFQGGTMSNAAAWPATQQYAYYLDGFVTASSVMALQKFYGLSGLGCIDASQPQGATNFLSCTSYGPGYSDPAFRKKYRLFTHSFFTAPGRPVVNVVNFVGSPAGLPFPGITCNRLHLDVTKFLLVNITTAQNAVGAWSGFVYPSGTPDGLVAANPLFTGFELWAQAMWNDSQTNAIKLTRAVSIVLPPIPRDSKRAALCQPDPALKATVGNGPYTEDAYNPVLRYAR